VQGLLGARLHVAGDELASLTSAVQSGLHLTLSGLKNT
jgi:hypothetical protein